MIQRELLRFRTSVLFFSRIPVGSGIPISEVGSKKAVRYLSWVGFIVSAICAVIMYYASFVLPSTIAVLLGIALSVFLTGGFHEDGLADVCDGFGGGHSRQRILDIMKDSHIGTYGTIGLILVLFFRIAALSEMPRFFMATFFILGNTLSRVTVIPVMMKYKYARDEASSKVHAVIGNITFWDLIIGIVPVIPILWFIKEPLVLLLIIPVWLVKGALARYFKNKIGGYTGDCLGAIQQICEIVFYIFALIWLKFTW